MGNFLLRKSLGSIMETVKTRKYHEGSLIPFLVRKNGKNVTVVPLIIYTSPNIISAVLTFESVTICNTPFVDEEVLSGIPE
ncbi:hypothetical protein TOC8171_33280 [Pseudomonas syringae]